MRRYVLFVLGLACSALASAQATIQTVAEVTGTSGSTDSVSISRDGTKLAGLSSSGAFFWSSASGKQPITPPQGYRSPSIRGVANNGAVVGFVSPSTGNNERGFYWTAQNGLTLLPLLPGYTQSLATAISDDGQIVVGYTEKRVQGSPSTFAFFRWTQAGGTTLFTKASDYDSPSAASTDGSVISGRLNSKQFRWTSGTGFQYLSETTSNYFVAMSSDGRFMLGIDANGSYPIMRWDTLGAKGGFSAAGYPQGISLDGSVIVTSESIWLRASGVADFFTYLKKNGANLTHWRTLQPSGISDDGQTIVGRGLNEFGKYEAFRATITPPSTALPPQLQSLRITPDPRVGGNDATLIATVTDPWPANLFVDVEKVSPSSLLLPQENVSYPGWTGVPIKHGNLYGIEKIVTHGSNGGRSSIFIDYQHLHYPASVVLDPAMIYDPVVSATTVKGGTVVQCTVKLNGESPSGGLSLFLSSSDTTAISLPDHVQYDGFSRQVSFPIPTQKVTSTTNVTVSFTCRGRVKTVTFTVTP